MIELKIKKITKESTAWKEKLLEMSVGHKVTIDDTAQEPVLIHGREKFEGAQAINKYMPELEKFIYNWRKCACEG